MAWWWLLQSSSTSLIDATWRSPSKAPGTGSPRKQAREANVAYHVNDDIFTIDDANEHWTLEYKSRKTKEGVIQEGMRNVSNAAMVAAATMKAASKFKSLKALAEKRRLKQMRHKPPNIQHR